MSATTFNDQFEVSLTHEITKAVNIMIKKYLPLAYCVNHIDKIDHMIMGSLYEGCEGEEHNELYRQVQAKRKWFKRMRWVIEYIKKAGKRKCNDCKKLWYDCRNTCYKPKTNPRPIEFPQDVFNIIKDYMDIVDVPTPMWNDMMKASIKDISANQNNGVKSLDYFKPYPPSVYHRKIPLALRKRRYWVGKIRQAKNMTGGAFRFYSPERRRERMKLFIIKRAFPEFWENLKFEATEYNWCVLDMLHINMWRNNNVKQKNGEWNLKRTKINDICKSMGKVNYICNYGVKLSVCEDVFKHMMSVV